MRLCLLLLFLAVFASPIPLARAASTRTWDGGGADALATTCANWSSNTCPVAGDSVTFDGTSTKSATWDLAASVTIVTFAINSGYTGTVTLSTNLTVTGTMTVGAGTLSAGSTTLTFTGSGTVFSVSGTFTYATSTVVYACTAACAIAPSAFYNLTINSPGFTVTLNYTSTVYGDFYVQAGTFSRNYTSSPCSIFGCTITIKGNLTGASGAVISGGDLAGFNLTGTTQAVSTSSNQDIGQLYIASAVTLNSNITTNWGTSIASTGTLDLNGYTLSNCCNTFTIASGGTLIANGGGISKDAGFGAHSITDNNATSQDLGALSLTNSTYAISLGSNLKASSVSMSNSGGTLALGTYNLTVGSTGSSGTGSITGSHIITSSASSTTTVYGTGSVGSTSGTWTFYNLTLGDGSSTRTTTLAGDLTVSNLFTTSASHTLDGSSKTITLSGAGSLWAMSGNYTASTSTIKLTDSTASTKTFAGASKTYGNFYNATTGSGTVTITGSNTFADIKMDPATVTAFTSGTTQTISSLTASGTSGNLVTIQSSSAGSAATLSKSSGTVLCSYCSIKDSTVTGGATWYAENSTNVSGNTGWSFVNTAGSIFIAATSTSSGSGTSLAWTHTVGNSSNRVLVVGVGLTNSGSQTVSSVTYGSQSLTSYGAVANGTSTRAQLWYLVAPTVGTGTITVTPSASAKISAGAWTLANVAQTTPFGTFISATGTSTAPSVNISSAATEVALAMVSAAGTPTVTAGTSETVSWTNVTSAGSDVRATGLFQIPGATTVTVAPTLSGSGAWAIAGMSVKPSWVTAVDVVEFSHSVAPELEGRELSWRTGREIDNLGFHIYRERGAERVRITPSLIGGASLLSAARLPTGRGYFWHDPNGQPGDAYVLESVALDGARSETRAKPREPRAFDSAMRGSMFLRDMKAPRSFDQSGPAAPRPRLQTGSIDAWEVPGDASAIKLRVSDAGLVRITRSELEAAGLSAGTDLSTLGLWAEGMPVALAASNNAIEFYGIALDTPDALARTYWLAPADAPKRITRVPAPELDPDPEHEAEPTEAPPASFPFAVERKQKAMYFAAFSNGDTDNFFGSVISQEPLEEVLRVHHLDAASKHAPRLHLRLQGMSLGAHTVEVLLNGAHLGTMKYEDRESGRLDAAIPKGLLKEGDNTLTLKPVGPEEDVSLFDTARVTYDHLFTADDDALEFVAPTGASIRIDGFSGDDVRLLDITSPNDVVELNVASVGNSSPFAIAFKVPDGGPRRMLALRPSRAVNASALKNASSNLRDAANGADLVMIAHASLTEALAPLVELRQSQGLKVFVANVEDVYDEFGFGEPSAEAIRGFLAETQKRWQLKPRYVLLAGDATMDPRNYLGFGIPNFVPTKTVRTSYMETASDDWLVDFDDNEVADLPIGRLPARTALELDVMVANIVAQSEAAARGALILSDASDEHSDFEGTAETLLARIASNHDVSWVTAGTPNDVFAALQSGPAVVDYVGHGSVDVWGEGDLLNLENLSALDRPGPAVVLSMTCLNGFFNDLYTEESLAEALIKVPGGAAAVWASSSVTSLAGQEPMNLAAMSAVLSEKGTLGDALFEAKLATSDPDVRKSWILFGDPTMRVRVLGAAANTSEGVPGGCTCRFGSAPSQQRTGWFWMCALALAASRRAKS